MNKHTPEPWGVWLNPDGCNRGMITDDALARHIVYVVGNTHEAKANGRRIIACVNACAGINPEAVPELLEALKRAEYLVRLLTVEQVMQAGNAAVDASGLHPFALNEGRADKGDRLSTYLLSAAIAKAESGES